MLHIRIATRRSPLALWQANHVAALLRRHEPAVTTELVRITTRGDKILDVPLAKVGGKGLFTKEIDLALADGRADIAVHSMKDVPTQLPPGMSIVATPERADPHDMIATRQGCGLEGLPAGARVGSSSLRRICQLKQRFPHLRCVPIRGSVQTRLRKLDGEVDAVILAAAGVRRLGLEERMDGVIPVDLMLPAVAQGTLGIQSRDDRPELNRLVARLDHAETADRTRAERAFLARLEGGCQVPIAAYAELRGDELLLRGMIGEEDGSRLLHQSIRGPRGEAETLGRRLADRLLDAGGREILARVYAAGGSGA
ncbi:MAG: hydroxymethylbilane synthase [Zetaproteobacteria bacterium]|nr:MAG: hydroxymethylbilane synthase [Zetaproteobacteria bacterium]